MFSGLLKTKVHICVMQIKENEYQEEERTFNYKFSLWCNVKQSDYQIVEEYGEVLYKQNLKLQTYLFYSRKIKDFDIIHFDNKHYTIISREEYKSSNTLILVLKEINE